MENTINKNQDEEGGEIPDLSALDIQSQISGTVSTDTEEQLLASPEKGGKAEAGKKRRKRSPGLLRLREFKRATHVFKTISQKDPNTLTQKERDSISWAKDIIANDAINRPKVGDKKVPEGAPMKVASRTGQNTGRRGADKGTGANKGAVPSTSKASSGSATGLDGRKTGGAHSKRSDFAAKRGRSTEESGNEPKRPKSDASSSKAGTTSKSFSQVAREDLRLALIDRGSRFGRYSGEQWRVVERLMSEAIIKSVLENPAAGAPAFDNGRWQHGVRILECKDKFSHDFAKETLSRIKPPWEGAKLELVPLAEIPERPKGRIWVPNLEIKRENLLQVLQAQNPDVPMREWEVAAVEEAKGNGRGFVVLVDAPSVPIIRERQGKLHFALGEVYLRLFKRSQPGVLEAEGVEGENCATDEVSADQPSS